MITTSLIDLHNILQALDHITGLDLPQKELQGRVAEQARLMRAVLVKEATRGMYGYAGHPVSGGVEQDRRQPE